MTLGYPLGFKEYQLLCRQGYTARNIGFKIKQAEVNRFAARLRMARSFEGLLLDGYSENTKTGYEGLFKVFLAHSALERFLFLVFDSRKTKPRLCNFTPMLESYDQEKILDLFQDYDPKQGFWSFFYGKCHKPIQTNLDNCISGEEVNVFQISAAIRHIFAHGHLTPSANQAKPKNVRAICDTLSEFLIDFMDQEFFAVVRRYCDNKGISLEDLNARKIIRPSRSRS